MYIMDEVLLCLFLLCVAGTGAQTTLAPASAECQPNMFGPNCDQQCSKYCQRPTCQKTTGDCIPALCKSGWKHSDPKCNTPCDDGWYGDNCGTRCSPYCSSSPCGKSDGRCPCKPGYQTPNCNKPCVEGTYGQDCSGQCGKCQGGPCNKITGECPNGCLPGYTRESHCRSECPAGKYGQDCAQDCGKCKEGTHCNNVNGSCSKNCRAGFKPSMCKEACSPGGWGENCLKSCSSNCQDPKSCDKVTGHCSCKPGFQPPFCKKPCEPGKYGQDCKGQCGECADGSTPCDHITGNCTSCLDNRHMPLCQACVVGKHGSACNMDCGHCGGDGACDRDTRVCAASICLPGWMTPTCDKKCPEGLYGQDCKKKCGHCRDNTPCQHDNGVCVNECEDEYEGVRCLSIKASVAGPVAGAVLGAGALIAIAIVVSVCYVKRHSKTQAISHYKEDFTKMADMASEEEGSGNMSSSQGRLAGENDLPSSPSAVYQNMQLNHNSADNPLNPASNYDRVDMTPKAEDIHHYEVHGALRAQQRKSLGESQESQDDSALYQNIMATSPAKFKADTAGHTHSEALAEPEATYGNI